MKPQLGRFTAVTIRSVVECWHMPVRKKQSRNRGLANRLSGEETLERTLEKCYIVEEACSPSGPSRWKEFCRLRLKLWAYTLRLLMQEQRSVSQPCSLEIERLIDMLGLVEASKSGQERRLERKTDFGKS